MGNKWKKTASIITVIVLIAVVFLVLKNDWIFKDTDKGQSYNVQEPESKENVTVDVKSDISLDSSMVVDADSPVMIESYKKDSTEPEYKRQVTITDYYYSRQLSDSSLKFKKSVYDNRYGTGVIDDDGNILKDYYYVYVYYDIKNIKSQSQLYTASEMQFNEVGSDNVIKNNRNLDKKFIYKIDYNGVFDSTGANSNFTEGSSIQYGLVYLVPEDMVKSNSVCVHATTGNSDVKKFQDKYMRYIKLNLEGRER